MLSLKHELVIMSSVDWRSALPSLQARTHQQVFGFYISVDNIQTVQVLDGTGQVEEHAAGISLCVFVRGDDCVKEIAALEKQWSVIGLIELRTASIFDISDKRFSGGKHEVPSPTPWRDKAHCVCQSPRSEAQCWGVSPAEGWTPHSGSCAPGQ